MVKIFIAGPVNASDRVRNKINFPEIGHRESEFSDLYFAVKERLLKLFNASPQYDIAIIGGSGTAAMESTISSVVDFPLIISNGAFGERMCDICEVYNIPYCNLDFGWNHRFDLEVVEKALKSTKIKEVCMVGMETSTGMLNPIHEVGKLCKKYKKIFIVDGVCAIAGEHLDMKKDNIDFCFISSNKGIGGPPVVGIVCCNKRKLKKLKKRSYYLDLAKYLEYGKIGQTPFTPAIPLFYLMNESLKDVFNEGLYDKIERHWKCTKLLRTELRRMKLEFYYSGMSNVMTNVYIPKCYNYQDIHDKLKDKGFLIYPGKGELDGKVMHIATMGNIQIDDVKDFVIALEETLCKLL